MFKKIAELMVPPNIPFMGDRDIDTITRQRKICWIVFGSSSFLTIALWVLLVSKIIPAQKNIVLSVTLMTVHMVLSRVAIFSARYFAELRDAFFKLRLQKVAQRLQRETGGKWQYTVRMRSFLFYPDLEHLQDMMSARFLQIIRDSRAQKLREQKDRDAKRLQQAHEQIDEELREAALRLGDSHKVRKALRKDLSLSRKRSLLADLAGFAIKGPAAFRESGADEAKLSKLVAVLAELADGEICEEAKVLHGNAKDSLLFKDKERLLSQAIEAQRAHRRKGVLLQSTATTEGLVLPQAVGEEAPMQYIRLWDHARNVFQIDDLLPDYMDKEMTKAILLVLIDPGSRERNFQAKYRPEDRLKKDVARYYGRIGTPFTPASFDRTLWILQGEGVLSTKPKTDVRVYGLTAKSSVGSNLWSRRVIERVVETTSALKS